MEQYCIYLRKSRADAEAEARGEGETLARHEASLLELAKRQDLHITQIHREVVSGETIAARPVMRRLLSEVEQGLWSGVLVVEVERLARGDTIDQGTVARAFKYSDTQIITPYKTYHPSDEMDEEYFEFGLFMSRREYKVINRRLQQGRVASIKEGKYVAHTPPYGYIRTKLEKEKGWTLAPHPEQADVIRQIFDWYVHGEEQPDGTRKRLGTSLIARRLNKHQIPSKKGGAWVVASVRDILINPVYIGKLRWNWRPAVKRMNAGQLTVERPRSDLSDCILADGRHAGIVEPAVFEAAQEYIAKNRARPIGERYTVSNPLAGIVVCGMCGRRMVRRPYSTPGYPPSLMCPLPECKNVSSHLHYVETRILEALEEWLGEYRLKWSTEKEQSSKSKDINIKRKALVKVDDEIVTLTKQLSSVHDLLEQGVYDTEAFLNRTRELGERIEQSKANKAALEESIHFDAAVEEARRLVIPKVEYLLKVYGELTTPEAKNDLLKDTLEKVVYTKEKGGRWHNRPDDFEITLFPKLPG